MDIKYFFSLPQVKREVCLIARKCSGGGGASVSTVNGISPDGNGNVALTSTSIPVEYIASGGGLLNGDVQAMSTYYGNQLNLKLNSVVAGTNITIDNTDPLNPVISASGGSSNTFSSGLTETNGNVVLGGELTEPVTVCAYGDITGATNMVGIGITPASCFIVNGALAGAPGRVITVGDVSISLTTVDPVNTQQSGITIGQLETSLLSMNGASQANFAINVNNGATYSNTDSIPMFYAADYSANYTDRSLVDKQYVDIRVPIPPPTGTYTLQSVDGVTNWVSV